MATLSVSIAGHATLSASTVDTVNLSSPSQTVVVTNRGAADIYYTFAAVGATAATPAVANDSYICPAGQVRTLQDALTSGITQVKLFSTGTPAYSVEGF